MILNCSPYKKLKTDVKNDFQIFLSLLKGPTGFSQGDDGFSQFTTVSAAGGIEYATAIPVAVSSLASDPKKMTIKKVAAPASTVSNMNACKRKLQGKMYNNYLYTVYISVIHFNNTKKHIF